MKITMILGVLAAGLAIAPLTAGTGYGDSTRGRFYSNSYQQWGERNQKSGLFQTMERKPMTEVTLLLQLDKDGRQKFRNLPPRARLEILETINHTGTRNYERVMEEVIESQNFQTGMDQERRLHNGMGRIPA